MSVHIQFKNQNAYLTPRISQLMHMGFLLNNAECFVYVVLLQLLALVLSNDDKAVITDNDR